jgi:hypothetical protein
VAQAAEYLASAKSQIQIPVLPKTKRRDNFSPVGITSMWFSTGQVQVIIQDETLKRCPDEAEYGGAHLCSQHLGAETRGS